MATGVDDPSRYARGERQGLAKLTEEDVRAIRRSDEPYGVLAKRHGVCLSSVANVKTHRTWRHV